jgi:hypothetical protein
VRIDYSLPPGAPSDVLTIPELLATAKSLGGVVGAGRPLTAVDVAPLQQTNRDPRLDVPDLTRRTTRVVKALDVLIDDFDRALGAPAPDGGTLRVLLRRASLAGADGAVAVSADGDDERVLTSLREQASIVLVQLRLSRARAATASSGPAPSSAVEAVRGQVDILRAVLPAAVAFPRVTVAEREEFQTALADSGALQGGDPMAGAAWLDRISNVRQNVARLQEADTLSLAASGRSYRPPSVLQLPHTSDDRWVALPPAAGGRVRAGRISVVLHVLEDIDASRPLSGILVDEWVEVVPSTEATTAVSFGYPSPQGQPPQTIILAVSPDDRSAWSLDLLERIVLETVELASFRAVDPDVMGEIGQLLPALLFAQNSVGDTVTTDFIPVPE